MDNISLSIQSLKSFQTERININENNSEVAIEIGIHNENNKNKEENKKNIQNKEEKKLYNKVKVPTKKEVIAYLK